MSAAAGAAASVRSQRPYEGDSYYGQPVLKEPVWTPEIPWYLFTGGLGGASATLAFACGRRRPRLARRAWLTALAAAVINPVLLISDLGRPRRFLNMLRMFKVTSPMSVGSWILAASATTTAVAAFHAATGWLRLPARLCRPLAALLGLPLSTYTGALLAQTAVPVWHEARRELPALFGSGAAASAGAAAVALAPVREAGPARRLAVIGAGAELVLITLMEHRLDELAEPYHKDAAGTYGQAARALTVAGALTLAGPARRSRALAIGGAASLLAGAVCERWSVFKAGFQSARDPKYTIAAQRRRIAGGGGHGASRHGKPIGG